MSPCTDTKEELFTVHLTNYQGMFLSDRLITWSVYLLWINCEPSAQDIKQVSKIKYSAALPAIHVLVCSIDKADRGNKAKDTTHEDS